MSASLSDIVAELHEYQLVVRVDHHRDGLMVVDVEHDSRAVAPGSLFCCVKGELHDGHSFVSDVEAKGAIALVASDEVESNLPVIYVKDVRKAMAVAASVTHNFPSREVPVFGITGTNGKTTTAMFLAAILEQAGLSTTVIGTLTGARTTPESTTLQRSMRKAISEGSRAVAMEVTSHALVLDRVLGTHFAAGVFTNLGRDHLDFHGSIENYFAAKALLFDSRLINEAIINVDDEWGQRLFAEASKRFATEDIHSVSLSEISELRTTLNGSTFRWRNKQVTLSIGGAFNVHNALCAAMAASATGIADDVIVAGLESVASVSGRLQHITTSLGFDVYVDFAHTPDALAAVLQQAQDSAQAGRVIVVFGCGGDRDRAKRGEMGEVANRLADVVVLTSDNSRSEEPSAIIADIKHGINKHGINKHGMDKHGSSKHGISKHGMHVGAEVLEYVDRRQAIVEAILLATAGDVVIVAGKGHERGQSSHGVVVDFYDEDEVRSALALREGRSL